MAGPHALWDDAAPSAVKRLRVTSRRTQLEAAGAAGCSLTAYHNLEARGVGSADLWARVAAVFRVLVEDIKPAVAPARNDDRQLQLVGASSS
jgi:DNA-binding XRE family transcriptional regulator